MGQLEPGASNPLHFQGAGPSSLAPFEQEPHPIFRRTFRTAGTVVALATLSTLILEVALVALVIRM